MNCGERQTDRAAETAGLRFVSVIFCDVVGSTQLATRFDPDVWATTLDAYFALSHSSMQRWGGRVEKFIGDAVVAVFGLTGPTEQAAIDAVQASLDLTVAVEEFGRRFEHARGAAFTVRTAVASGYVATADRDSSFAVGSVLNRAARLQSAAPVSGVSVDLATWLQVRDEVATEAGGEVVAKGFADPLPVWTVRRDAVGPLPARPAPLFVNRTDPRERLGALIEGTPSGRPALLHLVGDPGMGKTRLVGEVIADVTGHSVVLRCPPHGPRLGLLPAYRLLGALTDAIATGQTDVRVDFGLTAAATADERTPTQGRAELFSELGELLDAFNGDEGLLLVIDDAQWMSPPLREFLEEWLVTRPQGSITVLLCARPNSDLPGPADEVVTLTPLLYDESLQLASALMGEVEMHGLTASPLSPAAVIAANAAGNPLFVEQLAQLRGIGTGADALPPTAHAVLGARIDELGAPARRLLEAIAVYGQDVSAGEIEQVVPGTDTSAGVTELLAAGLLDVQSARRGRLVVATPIVGEVAYHRLTQTQRLRLHSTVCDVLDPMIELQPVLIELLAHHAERAQVAGRASLDRDALVPVVRRAVRLLTGAGRFALSRGDSELAFRLVERAATAAGDDAALLAEITPVEAYAHGMRGDFSAMTAASQRGRDKGSVIADSHARLNALFLSVQNRVAADDGEWSQVSAAAAAAGDDELSARARLYEGLRHMRDGDYINGEIALSCAADFAARVPFCLGTAEIYANLANAVVNSDLPADRAYGRCARIYRDVGGARLLSAAVAAPLAIAAHMAGDAAAAEHYLGESELLLTELGHGAGSAGVPGFRALLAVREGDFPAAIAQWRTQAERYGALGLAGAQSSARLRAAVLEAATGPEAATGSGCAVDDADIAQLRGQPGWAEAVLVRQAVAATGLAAGDRDAAGAALRELLAVLDGVSGAGVLIAPLLTSVPLARAVGDLPLVMELSERIRAAAQAKNDTHAPATLARLLT